MSVKDLIQAARTLSIIERKELIKALVDMLVEEFPPKPKRSIREFRGIGAHLYDGSDAQEYVNRLRSEWDDRP